MQAAITQLENYLSILETNAPINEAEGNFEQAALEYKNAKQVREALHCLRERSIDKETKLRVNSHLVGLVIGVVGAAIVLWMIMGNSF